MAATLWSSDFRIGLPVGIGVGIWCAYVKVVRTAEPTVLENAGVGAIGLLAVTLAAMAFLLAFMDESYTSLIEKAGGVKSLYRPFRTASIVSGAAALVCFVGAVDNDSGPIWWQAAVFALGMGLFSWAVVGVVQLVKVLLRYGERREQWYAMTKDNQDVQFPEPPDPFNSANPAGTDP